MTEDMRKLQRTIERIARETLPELRAAIEQNVDEDKLVALLAARVSGGLGGVVDLPPEAAVASPAAASDGSSDMGQVLAQVVLMNDHLNRIREIAEAWAESNGGGG